MSDSESILEITGLSVSYGRIAAVRDVSFSVPRGGLVTLVGANGAGKTSILSAVAGLVRPKSGTIVYRGKDVTRQPAHRRVADGIVLVPEGRQVFASLSVAENLQLGCWRVKGRPGKRIAEMYELFPVLHDRRRLPAGSLSGGEQQMLAIARAMVSNPVVVLMDEPSMGLAPLMVDEVYGVIETIRDQGTTVVLIEQNARRALRIADTGYVLETGEITHSGPSAELLADSRVISAYLGGE